mmetsp:Transcript_88041/g.234094  ORF Transcript_88041/g.234094 Transcript_88041/m.234094 type:complete len:209 (-) Transcript_88041:172-798(-)
MRLSRLGGAATRSTSDGPSSKSQTKREASEVSRPTSEAWRPAKSLISGPRSKGDDVACCATMAATSSWNAWSSSFARRVSWHRYTSSSAPMGPASSRTRNDPLVGLRRPRGLFSCPSPMDGRPPRGLDSGPSPLDGRPLSGLKSGPSPPDGRDSGMVPPPSTSMGCPENSRLARTLEDRSAARGGRPRAGRPRLKSASLSVATDSELG